MKEKGKFFWKKEWYSICSVHKHYDENCNMCNTGAWKNVYLTNIGAWFFDNFPNIWIWYVNLNKYKRINRIINLKN